MSYHLHLSGLGESLLNDPVAAYARLLQGQPISGGEFTQMALIEGTNIHTKRNVGGTLASDTAALLSGGINALRAAISNMGTVSASHIDSWDQAQAGGSGTTVNLATVAQPVVLAPVVTPAPPAPSTQVPPPLSPTVQVAPAEVVSTIPTWAWLGAAGLVLYSFSGGTKRR